MLSSCERKAWSQTKPETLGLELSRTSAVVSSRGRGGGGLRPPPKGFAHAVVWKLCRLGGHSVKQLESGSGRGWRPPLGREGRPVHRTQQPWLLRRIVCVTEQGQLIIFTEGNLALPVSEELDII